MSVIYNTKLNYFINTSDTTLNRHLSLVRRMKISYNMKLNRYQSGSEIMDNNNRTGFVISREDSERQRIIEKQYIRTIGSVAGACIVIYILLENILTLPIAFFKPLYEIYYGSFKVRFIFNMVMSVVCMLLPFVIAGNILQKKTRIKYLRLNKPKDPLLAVFSVPTGLFICLIANYATGILITVTDKVGYELSSPDISQPETLAEKIIYFVTIAVLPPIVEEIAIRGVVMQPLRKYGDGFAVIASSFVFAVLHGNPVQAPFALAAGIWMGYVVCITGSLLPSMAIHFLNNTYSVAIDLMKNSITNDELFAKYVTVLNIAIITAGLVGAVLFTYKLNYKKLFKPLTFSSPFDKAKAFILNPPMLIAVAILLYITSKYITRN